MPTTLLYILTSVILTTIVSLVGILALLKARQIERFTTLLIGLSAGALLGDVFIHILPEVLAGSTEPIASAALILLGIIIFFALERFLRQRHSHVHAHEPEGCSETGIRPVGHMNLISDGTHNFLDGIAIGASYLMSVPLGIATTVAVLLHEIPQEIGDFGLLLHAGFSKKKALLFNMLSASLAIVGALFSLLFSGLATNVVELVLPITAGSFLYIALADLLPELQETKSSRQAFLELMSVLSGIGLMFLLLLFD